MASLKQLSDKVLLTLRRTYCLISLLDSKPIIGFSSQKAPKVEIEILTQEEAHYTLKELYYYSFRVQFIATEIMVMCVRMDLKVLG